MNKDVYLWKMIIKPDSEEGEDPFEFCKKNDILGCGWRLLDENENRIRPKDIDECEKLGRVQYDNARGFVVSIHALKEMEIDDLIWTRNDGIYYLCRVTGKWRFENKEKNYRNDILNVVPVEFIEIGTIENIPGKVVNSFRARSALQRIHGNPALEASKMIYNNKTEIKYYDVTPVDKNDILEMLLPEDVEEIISFYLQCEKNYLIYSSTNKVDTEKYEFVAIARDGSHLCYPQVKTGNVSLDFNEYDCLTQNGNKVYLFAVSQNYIRNNNSEIIALTKDEIIDFVYNHKAIMPERIKMWL